MKASFAVSILAVLVLAGAPSLARAPDMADVWNGAEIVWRDVGAGIKEATQTAKPVIMVFHAAWCSACKRYRAVFKDPGIVEASRDFVMILVDVDKYPDVNGGFAPDGTYVPRTIFLDAEGNVRTEFKGATDPEHPHTIDIDNAGELLSLMRKARPHSKAPGQQAAE